MDPLAAAAENDRLRHETDPGHDSGPDSPDSPTDSDPHRPRLSITKESLLRPFAANQPKSLSGIALRAFCLGISLALSLLATLSILLLSPSTSTSISIPTPLWRAPFFLAALSAFHFLEFWTTAEGNHTVACIDSFLLTANWPSYAIAHSAAFLECVVVGYFFPERSWVGRDLGYALLALGLLLTVGGQVLRSVAMLHAGASFNHHIQTRRKETHALVTTGVYGCMRHPSYAAFFYWGLGTQLVLGNVLCFGAYAAVLWVFFSQRIRIEEEKLVEFFHEDYVEYRKRVGTLIPFIR